MLFLHFRKQSWLNPTPDPAAEEGRGKRGDPNSPFLSPPLSPQEEEEEEEGGLDTGGWEDEG